MTPAHADANARPSTTRLSTLTANRAFATVLLTQNVIGGALGLWSFGWALIAASAANLTLLLLFFRPALRDLTRTPRWRTPPPLLPTLGALALTLISAQALIAGLLSFWPQLRFGYELGDLDAQGAALVPLLLGAAVLVPLIEELAFRGLLLTAYERAIGVGAAGLLVAGLFAFAHGVPFQVLGILPAAWILTRAVQHTGSFWTGVIIHMLNNAAALALPQLAARGPAWLSDDSTLTRPQALIALGVSAALVAAATAWLRPRPATDRSAETLWSASLIAVIVVAGLTFTGLLLIIVYATFTGTDFAGLT